MRIGWVAPGGFDRSGTERVIPVLMGLLARTARDNEVRVVALHQGERPSSHNLLGANVQEMGGAIARGLPLLQRALRHLRSEHRTRPFDVLHAFWATRSGLAAVLAGKWLGVPTVVTICGGELARVPEAAYGGGLSWRTRLEVRLTLRLAGVVTAASEYALAPTRMVRPGGLLIPLGVDTAYFTPPVRRDVGPPWRLLQVSNLNRVKDQATLLRAFHTVRRFEPATRLDVVGHDALNGEAQQLAKDLGVSEGVTFRGEVPTAVVREAMRTSHLLLHTSRHESGPVVFLEAAACGLATAGTPVGHMADLAPVAAATVPIGDDAALATATVRLLGDAARRDEIAANAREFALTYDADRTATDFAVVYQCLRDGERAPASLVS